MMQNDENKQQGTAEEYEERDRRSSGRLHRYRLFCLVFGGAIGLTLLLAGGFQLMEFVESNSFCGKLCHEVMYPEYTTYQASPHSSVECTKCHVGPGASWMVKSKLNGLPQIFSVVLNRYQAPIPTPVENLRPARETCEACHRPERFSGDLARTHRTYTTDEANTEHVDTRVFKVGGGDFEVAKDIHWHIGANVWYLPLDEKRQDIAWVATTNDAGELLTVYVDPAQADLATPKKLAQSKRLMDCIDCHNRATHIFYSPSELIDMALAQGLIDQGLPYIKKEGLSLLTPTYPSLEEAKAAVESIRQFYRNSYPNIYTQKWLEVEEAVESLQEIATLTIFPDMGVHWDTHLDNLSHQGCLRCHGKLIAVNGPNAGQPIETGCTLCHYPI